MKFEQTNSPLCLDFANTVHCYTCENIRDDLPDFAAFVEWNRKRGGSSARESKDFVKQAAQKEAEALKVLEKAKRLRLAIYQIFSAGIDGRAPRRSDLAALNDVLGEALGHLQLTLSADRFEWTWSTDDGGLERLLWPIARSAADLLTSDERERVRLCNGEGCTWLFLDLSKNKTRRWCNMAECGNRAKARRYYERARSAMKRD